MIGDGEGAAVNHLQTLTHVEQASMAPSNGRTADCDATPSSEMNVPSEFNRRR